MTLREVADKARAERDAADMAYRSARAAADAAYDRKVQALNEYNALVGERDRLDAAVVNAWRRWRAAEDAARAEASP